MSHLAEQCTESNGFCSAEEATGHWFFKKKLRNQKKHVVWSKVGQNNTTELMRTLVPEGDSDMLRLGCFR